MNKPVDNSNNIFPLKRWFCASLAMSVLGVLFLISGPKLALAVDLTNPPPIADPANAAFNHVVVACYNDSGHCQDGFTFVYYFNDSTWTISGASNCTSDDPNGCGDGARVTVGSQNSIGGMQRQSGNAAGYNVGFPSNGPSGAGSPSNVFARYACDRDLTNCTRSTGGNESAPLFSPNVYYSDLNYVQNSVVRYSANASAPVVDHSTHIIEMLPANGTTTGNTVYFSLHAYISPDDVGTFQKIRINFYNTDQNIFLSSFGSPNLTVYFDLATTTGDFYAATTTVLGDGNYTVQASLQGCFYLLGLCAYNGRNFALQTNSFIVNQETFIGHLQSKATQDVFNILASTTATSTTALIGTCNPLSGSFNALQCVSWLLVPSRADLLDTMNQFYNGFLTRVPWGYATRFFTLMASSSSATLPRVALTLPSNFPSDLRGVTIIDVAPFDAFASTSLIATATSSDGHTFFSSFLPIWNIVVLFAFGWFVAMELISFFGGSSGPPEGGRADGVDINDQGGVGRKQYRPNRGDWDRRK